MSNQAYIQQEIKIIHKSKQEIKLVSVFDDFDNGSICLYNFFENDLELLKFVIEESQKIELQAVNDVLDSIYANKKGMIIEETWYEWNQIEPIFENMLN